MKKLSAWMEAECNAFSTLKLIILFLGINMAWFLVLTNIYSILGIFLGEQSNERLTSLPWQYLFGMIFIMALVEELIGRLPLICSNSNKSTLFKIVLLAILSAAIFGINGINPLSIMIVFSFMLILITALVKFCVSKKALIMTFILSMSFGVSHVGLVGGVFFHLLLQGVGGIMLCLLFLKSGGIHGKIIKPLLSTTIAHTVWNCIIVAFIIL